MSKSLKTRIISTIKLSFIFVFFALSGNAFGQCENFAELKGLSRLDLEQYVHDGYLNCLNVTEGQAMDVIKPVFTGQSYRVIVIGSTDLPEMKITVIKNWGETTLLDETVVIDNDANIYLKIWDYEPVEDNNTILSVTIPDKGTAKSGCVSVIIGVKDK